MAEKQSQFEELSALADGELESSSTRFLLRRLQRDTDGELSEKWARYHMAGDIMRGDAELNLEGFSAGVMSAIAYESQDAPAQGGVDVSDKQGGWVWPAVTGAAVAACAVMAVMLFQDTGTQATGFEVASSTTNSNTTAPTAGAISTPNVDRQRFATASASSAIPNGPANSGVAPAPFVGPKQVMVVYRKVPATHWEETPMAVQKRLNAYLINHNEFSAASLRQGPMQYGRLVSYDSKSDK